MKRFLYVCCLMPSLLGAATFTDALDVHKKLLPSQGASQKIFTSGVEEKQWKLAELKKERQKFDRTEKGFLSNLGNQLSQMSSQLHVAKDALASQPNNAFLTKKMTLLNESYQLLKEIQQLHEKLLSMLDQHIKLLQDYLEDPDFRRYKNELKIGHQGAHTFEELQTLNQMILDQEKMIDHVQEQEKNALNELKNRKQTAAAAHEAHRRKQQGIQTGERGQELGEALGLDAAQRAELAHLDEQLFTYLKERDALLLQEIEHKKGLLRSELFMARLQQDILKTVFRSIKPLIKVSEVDVAYAQDELAKKKHHVFEIQENYRKEIEEIDGQIKENEKKLSELSSRLNIPLGADLDEWIRSPIKTMAGYLNLLELAELNDQVLMLMRKKDLLEATHALEDEKIRLEAMRILVKNSFFKIIARKFFSDDDIRQEKKKYDAPKAETKANLSLIKERRSAAQHFYDQQKRALENVEQMRKELQEVRTTLFKGYPAEYTRALEMLNNAEEKIKVQVDALNKTINIYGDRLALLRKTNKQIEFIRSELESISLWYRPEHAISWSSFQAVIPHVMIFFADVGIYLSQGIFYTLGGPIENPVHSVGHILAWLLLILLLLYARRFLPPVIAWVQQVHPVQSILYFLLLSIGLLLNFIYRYFYSCMIWIMGFILLKFYVVSDPYPYIIWYLFSIPYLLYIANRFIRFVHYYNSVHGYFFIGAESQRRILRIFALVLHASIILLLFRKAFVLASYYKSEVPTIIDALYSIIVQLSLLCSITKEQILQLIPTRSEVGTQVYAFVDRFYYVVLAVIMVSMLLSNPYIGFSKLVLYIVSRLFYSVLLIPVLLWLHGLIKDGASPFFVSIQEGVLRERFDYAKTAYSLFVLALFFLFLFIGGLGLAKIWNWPDRLAQMHHVSDLKALLKTPLLFEGTTNSISLFSLLELLSFIVVGFAISYLVNRFIVGRIFDVLLIDPGIQNTVASLTSYLIILVSVILGFQAVGLGASIWYLITALGIGIGWVLKDPIADFIAYFIILVQRPVKIGDYVTMDEETKGVVRKITPRSVVIRRKNSTTLIVPNSMMIKRPLANWNYSRGFIAFDDIMLTVTYQADPQLTKNLLEKVLDTHPLVLKNPKPIVRLENFNEYGFVFLVRGFLSSNYTLDQWDIASDIRLEIVQSLRAHAIQLAVPMRVIVNKSAYGTDEVALQGMRQE